MKEYRIIAINSTVPVGTAAAIRQLVRENLTDPELDYDVVSNPGFLREGSAVADFLRPNRVVLGAASDRALAIMRDIYRPLYLLETPIVCTSNETAEVIKYAANGMLALRISFINEVANLCENICILGLSFKPNTDDIRESPGLFMAKRLLEEGATVNAYDPAAMEEASREAPNLVCMPDAYSACTGADLILIMTEWNEFRDLDFARIKDLVRTPNVFDTRNIYDPKMLRKYGYTYVSTGRS